MQRDAEDRGYPRVLAEDDDKIVVAEDPMRTYRRSKLRFDVADSDGNKQTLVQWASPRREGPSTLGQVRRILSEVETQGAERLSRDWFLGHAEKELHAIDQALSDLPAAYHASIECALDRAFSVGLIVQELYMRGRYLQNVTLGQSTKIGQETARGKRAANYRDRNASNFEKIDHLISSGECSFATTAARKVLWCNWEASGEGKNKQPTEKQVAALSKRYRRSKK